MTTIRLPVSRLTYDQHHFTCSEIDRIFALSDRWLGEEILRLCREIRALAVPTRHEEAGYNSFVLWDLIPEVAYRLGCRLMVNESTDFDAKRASGQDFRDLVAMCMVNVATGYLSEAETNLARNPIDILFRDAANGNPVAFALDRLVAPTLTSTDRFARSIREVSRTRGFEETGKWSPGLNRKDGSTRFEIFPDDEPAVKAPSPARTFGH